MERYAQFLLTEAVQYGAIQGSIGKLKLDKGSITGLSKTLTEVEDLLRGREYLDPLTDVIKQAASNLLFLRKSILGNVFVSCLVIILMFPDRVSL